MKRYKIKILLSAFIIVSISMGCKKYLDYKPQGALGASDLTSATAVDGLSTAAYAGIANDWWDAPITSNWEWGSIRGGDSYTGGGGLNDEFQMDSYGQFYLVSPDNNGAGDFGFPGAWIRAYGAISRCNAALRALNGATDAAFPNRKTRIGEMHFLRGHMFFFLKVMFNRIPWFDETLTDAQIALVSNTMSSDSLWYKIEGDFQTAIDDLPPVQTGEPGRANQLSAKAYLAKALLYHAYTQDDQYTVTGTDAAKLNQVVALTNDVINSGMYSL